MELQKVTYDKITTDN